MASIVIVYRVEAILDGHVYRWFTSTDHQAARLMAELVTIFPDITLMHPERVARHVLPALTTVA